MKRQQCFPTICILLVSATGVIAQQVTVPPVPPVAPVPPVPPIAATTFHRLSEDADTARAVHESNAYRYIAQAQADAVREVARAEREAASAAREAARFGAGGPFAFAPQVSLERNRDRAYERGQRALDGRRWDEALQAFTEASSGAGSRADGALYWKAYALAKMGRRDEAIASIAELTKTYASSRWLNDAKALELEVKQASGQKVAPGSEDTEDLKLLALNGLMQSDPERAAPLVENLLKTSSSPKLRERALFVLAHSDSTRGKQLVEQVARGGAGNPDLQLKAINYISASGKKTDNRQILWEIYTGSNDDQVKVLILSGLRESGDREHLLQIAKTEKSMSIRLAAISLLGASTNELWPIYQGETSTEVKQHILNAMIGSGAVDRVVEIAKTEKDPKLRRTAIQALSSMRSASANDALISLYTAETDAAVKRLIVASLRSQNNAKALVDFARKETDPVMKRDIVSQLSSMRSKEATDYLMELLK